MYRRLGFSFLLFFSAAFLFLSFASYSPLDQSFNTVSNVEIKNLMGFLGSYISDLFLQYFGLASYIIPCIFIFWSFELFRFNSISTPMVKSTFCFISLLILSIVLASIKDYTFYFSSMIGGFFGYFVQSKILPSSSMFLPVIIAISCAFIGCFLTAIGRFSSSVNYFIDKTAPSITFRMGKMTIPIKYNLPEYSNKKTQKPNSQNQKKTNQSAKQTSEVQSNGSHYISPSIDLLKRQDSKEKDSSMKNAQFALVIKDKLITCLSDFGVTGRIVNIKIGPVITLFEFEPDAGIRSARIIGLSDDISRYLKVTSTRITILPSKGIIGIEIPNNNREIVFLRDIIESEEFSDSRSLIPISLGKTTEGENFVVDLSRMPHLLIAGTTGSGKSVGVNSIILSILYKLGPAECKLLMIDPKMLELSVYDGIPHLIAPVVTDSQKAVIALKWVVKEMEGRYKMMSELGVRNILNYNKKVEKNELPNHSKLPFIIVVVDEMADLMVSSGKAIETSIQRISQMARAAGIHLILATQRPSVDVITGVIKANLPTRISFQVISSTDSRTILGYQGAEKLLGNGDMLFMPAGSKMIRVHGPFVSDNEVHELAKDLKQRYGSNYLVDFDKVFLQNSENKDGTSDIEFYDSDASDFGAQDDNQNESESLYKMAVQIVTSENKTSISYIQRKLRIGFNKAASLVEKMENEGILTKIDEKGRRSIIKNNLNEPK